MIDYKIVYFTALKKGLSKNFEIVEVDVVDCPDLTKKPFNLASQGECSNTTGR